jgi:hypothetical protein
MAIEGDGASVDQHFAISIDDDAVFVPRYWARAFVADTCDGTTHYHRLRFARFHRSAVRS